MGNRPIPPQGSDEVIIRSPGGPPLPPATPDYDIPPSRISTAIDIVGFALIFTLIVFYVVLVFAVYR